MARRAHDVLRRVHLGALVADNYTHFNLSDLAIPYASDWKPGAVALGVIAAWLLAAVELTSLAIKRLPKRVWRSIHLTSYAVFWLTSIHAALAGTDRANSLYQLTAAASIIAVAWALAYRLTTRRADRRRPARADIPPAERDIPATVKEPP